MCLLQALALLRVLLRRPTVLIRQTIQAVHTIHQSILKMMSMGKFNALLKSPKVYNKITKLNSIFLIFLAYYGHYNIAFKTYFICSLLTPVQE
jgi:hypothetical protein